MRALYFTVFSFLLAFMASPATAQEEPKVYMVTFTAEWCPNCKILDPKLASALSGQSKDKIRSVTLDMTNPDTTLQAFDKINGTLLGEVYGDYLGQTGIGILTAADSGEKLGCALRVHSVTQIKQMIDQAVEMVDNEPALQRRGGLGNCPPANRKQAL